MSIRHLARALTPTFGGVFTASSNSRKFATSAPSVYDYLIRFHIIDRDGARHTLKGLAGTSMAQALHDSGHFTEFDDFTFGPEIKEPDAHVYVSNEYAGLLGSMSVEEKNAIHHCAEDVRPTYALLDNPVLMKPLLCADSHSYSCRSRMASYIILDKVLNDITVAQAPHLPFVIP